MAEEQNQNNSEEFTAPSNQSNMSKGKALLFGGIGLSAIGGASWVFQNATFNYDPNKLFYLKSQYAALGNWQDILGRAPGAVKGRDFILNAAKAFEESFFRIPRTFGIYPYLSDLFSRQEQFNLPLKGSSLTPYTRYYEALLGRRITPTELDAGFLVKRGAAGKLGLFGAGGEEILSNVSLMPSYWSGLPTGEAPYWKGAHHITKPGESAQLLLGLRGQYSEELPFIVRNLGQGGFDTVKRDVSLFAHESLTRSLRLLDNPLESLVEMMYPDTGYTLGGKNTGLLGLYNKFIARKMGTGGNYTGSVGQLVERHAGRLAKVGLYGGLGYIGLSSLTRTVLDKSPEQIAGTALAATQLGYASISDITGLTSLNKAVEETAPGAGSPLATLGFSLFGGLTGLFGQMAYDRLLAKPNEHHWQTISKTVQFPATVQELASKVPLIGERFIGPMTARGRSFRTGAVAGALLTLPFWLAQLGSSKTQTELREEFAGVTEVPDRKGAFWEAGLSSFEGNQISQFKKSWYYTLMTDAKEKAMYGEYYNKPITRLLKDVFTPHWLAEERMFDRPYPISASETTGLGPLGGIYDLAIGQFIKPPMYIRPDEWKEGSSFLFTEQRQEAPNYELGGLAPGKPLSPGGLEMRGRTFLDDVSNFLGLRGFVASSMLSDQNFMPDQEVLQNASQINSISSQFYGLNIGGGFMTCFPPGTPINTRQGLKAIETVELGDEVWTDQGWKKVVDKFHHTDNKRPLNYIKLYNPNITLTSTENHHIPILQRIVVNPYQGYKPEDYQETEVEARYIKKDDYLLFPINQEEKLEIIDNQKWLSDPTTVLIGEYLEKIDIDKECKDNKLYTIESFLNFVGLYMLYRRINQDNKNEALTVPKTIFQWAQKYQRNWYQQKQKKGRKIKSKLRFLKCRFRSYRYEPTRCQKRLGKVSAWIFKIYFRQCPQWIKDELKKQFPDGSAVPQWLLDLHPKLLLHVFRPFIESGAPIIIKDEEDALNIFHALLKLRVVPKLTLKNDILKRKKHSIHTIDLSVADRLYLLTQLEKWDPRPATYPFYQHGKYLLLRVNERETDLVVPKDVYDLTIEDRHYYTVFGILVHNTEAVRRLITKPSFDRQAYNPVTNTLPSWLRDAAPYLDLGHGDPFSKVPNPEQVLPGPGFEALYPELEGVNPEEYPDIFKMKILGAVAPYSQEYKFYENLVGQQLNSGQLEEKYASLYYGIQEQRLRKEQKIEFAPEPEGFLGNYYATIRDVARMSPTEYIIPFAPVHKFAGPTSPYQTYLEREVLGTDFPKWESPISSFIKPALNVAGYDLGLWTVPESKRKKEAIAEYFDALEYEKESRVQEEARAEGDNKTANIARIRSQSTYIGGNPFANEIGIRRIFGAEGSTYLQAFAAETNPEEQEKLLSILPSYQRRYLDAQYKLQDLRNAAIGQSGMAPWELDAIRADYLSQGQAGPVTFFDNLVGMVNNSVEYRKLAKGSARAKAQQVLENYGGAPGNDWTGWDSGVDVDDIKLKTVEQEGYDFHDFNLWDTRAQTLYRKPYIDDQSVSDIVDQTNPFWTSNQTEMLFNNAGLSHVFAQYRGSGPPEGSIQINYQEDKRKKIRDNMKYEGLVY